MKAGCVLTMWAWTRGCKHVGMNSWFICGHELVVVAMWAWTCSCSLCGNHSKPLSMNSFSCWSRWGCRRASHTNHFLKVVRRLLLHKLGSLEVQTAFPCAVGPIDICTLHSRCFPPNDIILPWWSLQWQYRNIIASIISQILMKVTTLIWGIHVIMNL